MISSGLMELSQSRKDLYQLMERQSFTLLEAIIIASNNSLLSNEYLEEISRQRLLDNANMIRSLYQEGTVSNELLERFRKQNELKSIHIISSDRITLFSGTGPDFPQEKDAEIQAEELEEIFNGESDTLILGLRSSPQSKDSHYSVALATVDRKAILVSFDADRFLEFRKNTGFGTLLNQVADENKQIHFIAFQDTEGILAATGNVTSLEAIDGSTFLSQSLEDSVYMSRITSFDDHRIFELTHPFTYRGEAIGLIRMGLSTEPLQEINRRIFRRMIISTVVLVFIGFILITYLFIRQRLTLIQKRYKLVESYSAGIIENVSDAILVFDMENRMRIFNSAAETLFGITQSEALIRSVTELFSEDQCSAFFKTGKPVRQIRCRISGQQKYLLLSRSTFMDSDELEYVILVVRDLTEQKHMEEQIQRKNQLSAMGELASGVAHEIRNPLNAIGTIVQQLQKDFVPEKHQEEYSELTDIVYGEVRRINQTILEFLRFSRPEPILPLLFEPGPLIEELKKQYRTVLEEKQIVIEMKVEWQGEVFWDRNQIKQVLINLMQNAIEAIGQKGLIRISLSETSNKQLLLTMSDNGPGMDRKTKENLFNLYFTTKASGTGIGLSLVQRIIYEHGGVISFESEQGKGTRFSIQLPRRVDSQL